MCVRPNKNRNCIVHQMQTETRQSLWSHTNTCAPFYDGTEHAYTNIRAYPLKLKTPIPLNAHRS